MALEITKDDFIGKFTIVTKGYKDDDLALYIERYKTIILVEMFGKELYDLWIADVDSVVHDEIYTKLLEPFIEQPNCEILNSRGVVDMLLGFIYYNWLMDAKTTQTSIGGVKVKGQVSELPLNDYGTLFDRYNESVDTYRAIQKYICENSSVYPTFKGITKSYKMLAW